MTHYAVLTQRDWSNELSSSTFPHRQVTAVYLPDYLTAWGSLKTAIDGVSIGEFAQETLVMDNTVLSPDPASSPNAQRERKWLVRYSYGTPAVNATLTIPCADASATLLLANQDKADLSAAAWQTFKTAFEAFVVGPAGETPTIQEIILVGRNI